MPISLILSSLVISHCLQFLMAMEVEKLLVMHKNTSEKSCNNKSNSNLEISKRLYEEDFYQLMRH
jgi:hypothetical protein